MGEFNAQELANTAWAFATADQSDVLLFAALVRAALWRHVGKFNAQGSASTAWAFAAARRPVPTLLDLSSVLDAMAD